RDAEIAYWIGVAREAAGDSAGARNAWKEAAKTGSPEKGQEKTKRVSDRQVQVYFGALAQQKLGQKEAAEGTFRTLVQIASQHGDATSEKPGKQSPNKQKAMAHYLAGLGHLGLGELQEAKAAFERALQTAPDMLGAKAELAAAK
ncbi:MAG TPA: tetratricopeptide repeat protein, partial [Clostridia bacterium]|nr:tetratricopeptide repeat protein [Clostridia bacterium]